MGSGASDVVIDSYTFGAVGTTQWQTPDFDPASDRYDISLSGGASQLVVTTH